MTQIGGFIPGRRRGTLLGVHSLDHFALAVPDLAQAETFYGSFGLDTSAQGGRLQLRTAGGAHVWGSLQEGSRKRLAYLSFGAFADEIDAFRKRLDEQGVARTDPPAGVDSNGLWFRDADGTAIEIKVAEKSSPDAKSAFANPSAAAGQRGAPLRGDPALVRPRRMAHVLLFTPDVPRAIRFYSDVLGMRLSDEAGGLVAFMHGIHGSDHHMLAFAKSDGPGFHHASWDVGAVQDVGLGAMQMADRGFSAGWGLGRHVLGSNYFHYVRDPWGSFCEYSADIDYIPAEQDWEGQSHAPENSFYLWGPLPPTDFVVNHESART
jgi:catechol 2,3-dioxygenase-like lactoylglutathione lyase family enzyme